MKFACKTEINLSINEVVALFMDKSNYRFWKKDFTGYEPISGTPGEVGAVTKLVFKRVTMLEIITANTLPAELKCVYDHRRGEKSMMIHEASNRFTALAANKTRYELER
jgi:hypothetical protein